MNIFGGKSLERAVTKYAKHYQAELYHQGVEKALVESGETTGLHRAAGRCRGPPLASTKPAAKFCEAFLKSSTAEQFLGPGSLAVTEIGPHCFNIWRRGVLQGYK